MPDSYKVSDALNSLSDSNIRGHVNEAELRALINDYFGSTDEVESDSDSDDSLEEDEAESIPAAEDDHAGPASDTPDNDIPDDDYLVNVDEVPSVLGTTAHKILDVTCENDEEELQRIREFTCHCQHYKNGPCFLQFSSEMVLNRRNEMKSLTEGKFTCTVNIFLD